MNEPEEHPPRTDDEILEEIHRLSEGDPEFQHRLSPDIITGRGGALTPHAIKNQSNKGPKNAA